MRFMFYSATMIMVLGLGPGVPAGWAGAPRQASKPFDPPRLEITPGGWVDLGELGPLEPKEQRYRFRNASPAPIALRVLDLSPGVTVAGPALEQPIPPGASAELALRVDPAGWEGIQQRNVRLGTDDPGQGSYYLPVRLAVRPDLSVDGVRRSFGDVGVQESPLALFTFVRETGQPVRLQLATPLPDYLECETRGSGPRVQLAFVLRPGRIRPGMRQGLERVRVDSNAPLQPRFDLYLEWRIHHAIEAVPARAVFLDAADTLELKLKSRNGLPFRILRADLEGDGFRVGPVPARAEPEQTLTLRRIAAHPGKALLVLRCSGLDEPLEVPVSCVSSAPAGDEGVMVVPDKMD